MDAATGAAIEATVEADAAAAVDTKAAAATTAAEEDAIATATTTPTIADTATSGANAAVNLLTTRPNALAGPPAKRPRK